MDNEALRVSPIGQLVPIRGTDARFGPYACFAYLAHPLPEDGGELGLTMASHTAVAEASASLARLDQACEQLTDPGLLIRPALFREALDTSALEGTYGQLTELLEGQLPGFEKFRSPETREILGYVHAATWAADEVRARPISVSMLSAAQSEMFRESAHRPVDAGDIRRHQVWIGERETRIDDARFVPAPGDDRLAAALDAWVRWVESPPHDWANVLRAAVSHYQFETLHPFGDGNGRMGRLIIVLQLLRWGVLRHPALTLSPWLLNRRTQYQDALLAVSCTGDWNPWVQFFCRSVIEQSASVIAGTVRLIEWLEEARGIVTGRRWAGAIYEVLGTLTQWPVVSVSSVAARHRITHTAASNIIGHLVDAGILTEMSGRSYGRSFGAAGVMQIVEAI